jgi:hypothetical protein
MGAPNFEQKGVKKETTCVWKDPILKPRLQSRVEVVKVEGVVG